MPTTSPGGAGRKRRLARVKAEMGETIRPRVTLVPNPKVWASGLALLSMPCWQAPSRWRRGSPHRARPSPSSLGLLSGVCLHSETCLHLFSLWIKNVVGASSALNSLGCQLWQTVTCGAQACTWVWPLAWSLALTDPSEQGLLKA